MPAGARTAGAGTTAAASGLSRARGHGRPRLLRFLLLLLVNLRLAAGVYWGSGWEDPVTKNRLYKALLVERDETAQVAEPDVVVDDNFNWGAFEGMGGRSRVKSITNGAAGAGARFFEPQPLQSWHERHDAVRHGHYMLYRMDDAVTHFDDGRTMEEYIFSISIDVGVHPDYTSQHSELAAGVNCSVRFTLYERAPEDLGAADRILNMVDYDASYQLTLRGGNPEDLDTRRHNLLWGTVNNPFDGSLDGNCTRPVRELYLGVQCMTGYAFPQGSCTINPTVPPTFDDCYAYCPFTLTVRPMPKVLRAGEVARVLLAPGQWAAFELEVGAYDLLDLTIDRPEFDNITFLGQPWKDGFTGRAWLSKGGCLTGANVSVLPTPGYCTHGDATHADPLTGGQDLEHRFCTAELNYTYEVNLPPGTQFVRTATIDASHGVLDDLGFYKMQETIAQARAELDASMHYPTQLAIRARIDAYQSALARLERTNATWRRRWPLRMCTGPAEAGTYTLTVYADMGMDARSHAGSFLLNLTTMRFDRSPLMDRTPRAGCLRRGGSEGFVLYTRPAFPEHTSIGMAQVARYYVTDDDNQISSLSVRREAPPTASQYDARVSYPSPLRVAMSACDAQASQAWHFSVELAADSRASEVFFELAVELEDATRELGESLSGMACCGQYKYYAFPGVASSAAPRVDFNLTAGRLKAVYWRYASCPVEELHVRDGRCRGWCVVDWYRIFSGNLGKAKFYYDGALQVPYGMGEAPDKRRSGTWYLGIQALENEEAEYALTTSWRQPVQAHDAGCDRLDWYCHMPNRFKDVFTSAAAPRRGGGAATGSAAASALLAAAVAAMYLVRAHQQQHHPSQSTGPGPHPGCRPP